MSISALLLRAQVYAALDVFEACGRDRDDPDWRAACADVVRVHRLAPLIEYQHLLEAAERLEATRAARIPELVALIRDSYPREETAMAEQPLERSVRRS